MTLFELINQHKDNLTNGNTKDKFDSLLFALQIPSICSRKTFPPTTQNKGDFNGALYRANGRPCDSNLFRAYIQLYREAFRHIYTDSMTLDKFIDALYQLRCQITHEGVVMHTKNHFYFIPNASAAMILGDIIFLPIETLCTAMFETVRCNIDCQNLSVSPFQDIILGEQIYEQIREDNHQLYQSFWDIRPERDNHLHIIYTKLFQFDDNKKNAVIDFFDKNPDGFYTECNVGLNYGLIFPDNEFLFTWQQVIENVGPKPLTRTDIELRLNKTQFDDMLQIAKEVDDFANQHPFDISNYVNGGHE